MGERGPKGTDGDNGRLRRAAAGDGMTHVWGDRGAKGDGRARGTAGEEDGWDSLYLRFHIVTRLPVASV